MTAVRMIYTVRCDIRVPPVTEIKISRFRVSVSRLYDSFCPGIFVRVFRREPKRIQRDIISPGPSGV